MAVASIARPINPPSASISRNRWPLAVPPTAGLHGMCATVSVDSVQSPTRTPSRTAAYAASQPAWPAPTTMTSKWSLTERRQPQEPSGTQSATEREGDSSGGLYGTSRGWMRSHGLEFYTAPRGVDVEPRKNLQDNQ